MNKMIFRNARLEDLATIIAIYNSTIESRMVTADVVAVTIEDKIEWFNTHHAKRPLWIVEDNNETLGWVSMQDFYGRPAYAGTAEISIYLEEGQRGKGYGKMILEKSIQQAKEMGIDILLGYIFAHNRTSLKLFLHAGFEEWGHLPEIAVMEDKRYSLKILGKKINS